MLFADDAALTAHTEAELRDLINCFSDACNEFILTISIKKTTVLGQNVSPSPSISIGDSSLDVVEEFTYLGSVITSSLNVDLELNGRIGKASSIMGHLSRRVLENTKLTTNTKIAVYQACARDEEAAQTSEGSIGYLGRHSPCVPDLQEDLPLADWALQPQSPLQLDHRMTTKAQTHCLPRQKDANNNHGFPTSR